MKYIRIFFLLSLAISTAISCDSASSKIKKSGTVTTDVVTADDQPVFQFESEEHDFGIIEEGTVVTHEFVFTNAGKAPLVITSAQGSCGCTVPEYPRDPVMPGKKGVIKVSFDSSNRAGRQDKTVTLIANTVPNTKILKITSEVVSKKPQNQ
ncbi:hypothetical protein JCM31826_14590 [Thermaurantimonas aggregans]|uniref:DUF1573 domain-containing protein n=1 Tax=Thermaurantimonas aggregans TaxID=2173829 RepID=A0A401XLU0_9FLAO|nr:DUF1573 domain-containing protein [Thermaurantimonas aggregans]MCX8149547.1 DUF1573 domain-containing protein [Thermaurantimonas aggregans]GCD77977.1 hypothetical protein JCM31826_14590 [Thermaurantimonas aggregans]